jgi:PEP-CTERM motif
MKTKAISLLALASLAACAASAATLDMSAGSSSTGGPVVNSLSLPNYNGSAHTVSSTVNAQGIADGWITAAPGNFQSLAHVHVGNPLENAQQNNSATVLDRLFVSSATLPLGTPVDLSLSMSLGGFTTYFESPVPSSGANIYLDGGYAAYLEANSTLTNHQTAFSLITDINGAPSGISSATASGVLHSAVGAEVGFYQKVFLNNMAFFIDGQTRDMKLDFSNGFHFFADSLNPAVTLSSQTGHNYSITAVPEPGSVPMWLAGVGALGWLVRRRRESKLAA